MILRYTLAIRMVLARFGVAAHELGHWFGAGHARVRSVPPGAAAG